MTIAEVDEQVAKLSAEREALNVKITELRRTRPAEQVSDYTLHSTDGSAVKLSELFGDKKDLIVIHNMGPGCSYCTLWADGFNGFTPHLEDRAAFVVVSPAKPEVQGKFAEGRGWTFRMVSADGTTFIKDLGFEPNPGEVWPGVSTFRKQDDCSIVRVSRDYLGPGDVFCSVWHSFDMLAEGVNNWEPRYKY